MVESSKILTVSYGTFSCTLEGFEDSFSTMKAIAEYFRDLAAGDRYFGAEPPTPDAEMLSRIAEREIARRVEASESDGGIHLRAAPAAVAAPLVADDTPAAEDTTTAPMAEEAPAMPPRPERPLTASAPLALVPETTEEDAAETAFAGMTDMPAAEARPAAEGSSIADRLERIRAVVGDGDLVEDEDGDITAYDADETAVEDLAPATDDLTDEADAEITEAEAELVEDETVEAVAEDEAEVAADEAEAEVVADDEAVEIEAAADDDDVEAHVAEVTEVEADEMESADAEDISIEAEAQEDLDAEFAADVAEDITDEAATFDEPQDDTDDDRTDDQISAVLRNLERAGATIPDDVEINAQSQDTPEPAADIDIASLMDDEIAAVDSDDSAPEGEAAADLGEDAADDDVAATADAPEEAPKTGLRARILRVTKRVTAPAAEAAPEVAETAEPDAADEDDAMLARLSDSDAVAEVADDVDYGLSPDDEADLQAALRAATEEADTSDADVSFEEVAEVEETVDAADDDVLATDDADDMPQEVEAEESTEAETARRALPDNDDAAMSRIMDQADEELSDPEGSRRRAAIAQLKAAVAATEAARQLGEDDGQAGAEEKAFRDDLNEVVRPRRAARTETSTPRPERPRPAPLKLVAEQRIDAPEATSNAMPVRPRRVASQPAAPTDAASFAEFAEEQGAVELPDLLEAAAAYTAYVEGEQDFSRPDIMNKVKATIDRDFSREDGLRTFGTLLRQGRISKSGNGRFQVSDQTRFKPEQKAG